MPNMRQCRSKAVGCGLPKNTGGLHFERKSQRRMNCGVAKGRRQGESGRKPRPGRQNERDRQFAISMGIKLSLSVFLFAPEERRNVATGETGGSNGAGI